MVDNATDGFSLYDLETGKFIRKFPTGVPKKTHPKQVTYGEGNRIVVGGSDHGAVYVFDRKSGKPLDVLHHANQGPVHTVTVSNISMSFNSRIRHSPRLTHPRVASIQSLARRPPLAMTFLSRCGNIIHTSVNRATLAA